MPCDIFYHSLDCLHIYDDFLKKGRGEAPKSFIDKGLRPQKTQKNIEQGLDIGGNSWYNTCMKYTVIRYHSKSVCFSTLLAAEEFAMNCGDYKDLVVWSLTNPVFSSIMYS